MRRKQSAKHPHGTSHSGKRVRRQNTSHTTPPMLGKDDIAVTGALTHHLKRQNKRQKIADQLNQEQQSYWTTHHGTSGADYKVPVPAANHRGKMCPAGLALNHPAADLLVEYATVGCLTKTGGNWSMCNLKEAIEVGPHISGSQPRSDGATSIGGEREGSPRTSKGSDVGGHQEESTKGTENITYSHDPT